MRGKTYRRAGVQRPKSARRQRLTSWRPPSSKQEELEAECKRLLTSLKFTSDSHPSKADQTHAALAIADLLQQAKAIGHAHAADETQESSAWGGNFANVLASAWDIVQHFVDKISAWIDGQDAEDLTEADIEAQVETLADHVGDYEVAAAIEQEVLDTLAAAGEDMLQSYPQPGCCSDCQAIADAGPTPISQFQPAPYHNGCRCSSGPPNR